VLSRRVGFNDRVGACSAVGGPVADISGGVSEVVLRSILVTIWSGVMVQIDAVSVAHSVADAACEL